ncbi:MAG: cell division protein FtsZ [Dehalococcoidia bacterium]|nr:cell division protein FtsZ [Dehalococcoidia bacterium]
MPEKRRTAFRPERLQPSTSPDPIIPQILGSPDPEAEGEGFTEVRIVGVGGAGVNAVGRMIEAGLGGARFISVNTDAQALGQSEALIQVQIGKRVARSMGTGGDPDLGQRAAEENRASLEAVLRGAHLVFIAVGLGGGTGTGAAPVIADLARQADTLTVAVVTLPFVFEGTRRRKVAENGLMALRQYVDAMIVIPNDRLHQVAGSGVSIKEAFSLADNMLRHGVQGIADLVTVPGLINLDFSDVRTVMEGAGSAMMSIGEGQGAHRAIEAARAATESPLLETSMRGARAALLNITGSPDLTLAEVSEAAQVVTNLADPEANIIFGAVVDPRLTDTVRVTLIATGIERDAPAPPAAARRSPAPWRRAGIGPDAGTADSVGVPSFLRRGNR